MSGINKGRVIAGGLLAGLLLNLGRGFGELALGVEMERLMDRLGLAAPGAGSMMLLAAAGFLLGILGVWLYAAVRPRYGAGPRTAALIGIVLWALVCLFPNATMLAFGILETRFFWLATAVDLVYVPAAVVAGAWAYREAEAPLGVGAPAVSM